MDYIMLIKIMSVIVWLIIGEITWRILYYSPIKFFHKEHNDTEDTDANQLTRKIRPIVCILGLFSFMLFAYLICVTKEARPLFFKHGLTLFYKLPDDTEKEKHESEI